MSPELALHFVHTSAQVLGLSLDDARARRVAGHLQRTAAMARLLDQQTLPPEVEPPVLYTPAPHVLRDLTK